MKILKNVISQTQINYFDDHLRRLIHNFDKDNDFAINFHEFACLTVTKRNNDLKNKIISEIKKDNEDSYMASNRRYIKGSKKEEINEEILSKFCKLIQAELMNVNKLAIISEQLRDYREITSYEAFLFVDRNNDRYLNSNNITNFLNKFSKGDNSYTTEDAENIIFRLSKINSDQICYDDFQEIYSPIRIIDNETDLYILDNSKNLKINGQRNKSIESDKMNPHNHVYDSRNNEINNNIEKLKISEDFSILYDYFY